MVNYRVIICFFLLALTAIGFNNCGSAKHTQGSVRATSVSPVYSDIDIKIIRPKCLECHKSGPFVFSTYDTLMASGVIIPNDPENSEIYKKLVAGIMPKDAPRLSDQEIAAIAQWIREGATSDIVAPKTPPVAPSGVVAEAINQTSIMVRWNALPQTVTKIIVARAPMATGPYTVVNELAPTGTNYTDND